MSMIPPLSALAACAALCLGTLSAHAHEPYLVLQANDDGTVKAEAGFSDGGSPEGLKLSVRDRATGATLAEHTLPADGTLTLPIPAVPYRIAFDAGPGHRISEAGPLPQRAAPDTPEPSIQEASIVAADASADTSPPLLSAQTLRIAAVTGIFFLFGAVSFGLGLLTGRLKTPAG